MTEAEKTVWEKLFALRDEGYRDFQAALMPTVQKKLIIGVRTPALRKLAKELSKTPLAAEFIKTLPHKYYEENNLHAFLIEEIKDFDICVAELCRFLPFVDNWATCDMMSPKILKKYPERLLEQIKIWLLAGDTYTVRFGLGELMNCFLDENFRPEHLELAAAVRSEEYYVKMMVAWFFATALAKQYDAAAPYIENRRLEKWTHNKAIQKAVESYRVSAEQKEYLKTLKIK